MTKDHRRKKAVRARAAATGRSYLSAANSMTSGDIPSLMSAQMLRDALANAMEAAGWPVEIEWHPQAGGLRVYAGPATIEVGRVDDPAGGLSGDEHPDDPAVFDLAAPLRVAIWAPLVVDVDPELNRVAGVDACPIPANQPVGAIAVEIDQVVGAARRRDLTATPARGECAICGDRYPTRALFMPTRGQTAVCPCCAFDGDLLRVHPAYLAYQIDRANERSIAQPAGWAGAQVLLCCLGGAGLQQRLHAEWRDSGTLFEPAEAWSDPAQTWIWLPPVPRRPAALAGLGCGAALAAVTAAIEQAHPDLRGRYQRRRDAELAEYRAEEGEEVGDHPAEDVAGQVPEAMVERLWPAVIAYALAMLTQQAERPGHRDPWHVLQSIELGEWIDDLAPDLDSYHAETVLRVGILAVLEVLDPAGEHEQ